VPRAGPARVTGFFSRRSRWRVGTGLARAGEAVGVRGVSRTRSAGPRVFSRDPQQQAGHAQDPDLPRRREAGVAQPAAELPRRVHAGPRAEVDEQRQHVGLGTGAAARLGEDVEHRQGAARLEHVADPAEQGGGGLGRQVVDEVEAQHRVVALVGAGREVRRGRVTVAEPHPVGQAGGGDQLTADRGAARQVEYRGGQRRVALGQARGVRAVAAADVEERAGAGGQRQLAGHLGRRQAGELALPGHVAAPVRVTRRRVMRAARLAGPHGLVQAGPPVPVVGGPGHVAGDRQRGGGVQPAPGLPAQPVPAGPLGDVPGGAQAVQQEPGGQRVEPEVGGDLPRGRMTRGQAGGDPGADGRDHHPGQRHPAPGAGGGRRHQAGPQRQPLNGVGPVQGQPHLTGFFTKSP
jgi:hypothetical protein